jgi:hypothetical protein
MTVRVMRTVTAAAVLLVTVAAPLAAQRSPTAGESMFMIGGSQLDLSELNDRFAGAGYPTVDEQFLQVGFVTSRAREHVRLGFEVAGLMRPGGTTANNLWRTRTGAGYAMLNLGLEAFREGGLSVVPKVGIGAGAVAVRITDRQAPTFDEVLAQPGRGVSMSSGSLLLDGSVGLRYRVAGRTAAQRRLVLGIRGGYTQSLLHSEWTREHIDAPGGPTAGWGGPHFGVMIGRTLR